MERLVVSQPVAVTSQLSSSALSGEDVTYLSAPIMQSHGLSHDATQDARIDTGKDTLIQTRRGIKYPRPQ